MGTWPSWRHTAGRPAPPLVLAPETRPGVWFHDPPALATLRGNVVVVEAGATQAGMAMAGVVPSGPGAYQARVASGVGTSQEGEAMALLSYARRPAKQPGVYWLVPDSEAAVGALRTYQEGGHCGDGIHHLYATVLGGAAPLPEVRHQCGDHTVALNHGPQRPCGRGDAGAAKGRPHVAPQAPLLIYPPSALPRPVPALPDGAERLVAGPGLHTGASHLRGPLGVNSRKGGGSPWTGSTTTSSATSRRTEWTKSRPWPS